LKQVVWEGEEEEEGRRPGKRGLYVGEKRIIFIGTLTKQTRV
jgi:hypothetical protein